MKRVAVDDTPSHYIHNLLSSRTSSTNEVTISFFGLLEVEYDSDCESVTIFDFVKTKKCMKQPFLTLKFDNSMDKSSCVTC